MASRSTPARVTLAALIASVAVGVLFYRALVAHSLQQTAALFIGVPAVLAIVVVFAVSPKSATGVACKAVTIALLVSLIFLWEGMLCVLMSAPLFYAVAIGVARLVLLFTDRDEGRTHLLRCCAVLLAIAPIGLEGVTPFTTINRDESVTATRLVTAPPDAIARALLVPPRFDRPLPLLLRAGFPSPIATHIDRQVGETRWTIRMRGGEMLLSGMEPQTGNLTLVLEESGPGVARWRARSDGSHMTHFLDWQETEIRWQAVDALTTNVTCTIRYRRALDPAWYFGPMERFAVGLAAGYLIDSVATP